MFQQHIVEITNTLRTLLFPGYYEQDAIQELSVPYTTGQRAAWVYRHLSKEINRCLCFECREGGQCELVSECAMRARQTALEEDNTAEARARLQKALDRMEEDVGARAELESVRDEAQESLRSIREKSRNYKELEHELALKQQSVQAQLQSTRETMDRMASQVQRSKERMQSLSTQIEESDEPLQTMRSDLEDLLHHVIRIVIVIAVLGCLVH